ncbi:YlxR family protein [Nesterenkonia lutea]|uniref:RNA-binding protein YlxR (DUF448 family) n=1 Tax=Nesterenkonia lutea TaxID=272919 RepID=A0ABR9JF17_9MICC|nr:putative RNA-binding protein YlxR (DUF448 family) [Nesterenkonia lutea]
MRTCIGCRRQVAQDDVVRLALIAADDAGPAPEQVVWDTARALPGRGAWLHPQRECFDAAVRRKAFNRAFRRSVETKNLQLHDINGTNGTSPPPSTSVQRGATEARKRVQRDGSPMNTDA